MHMHVCVTGGKKCKFLGKFCVRTKGMIPMSSIIQRFGQFHPEYLVSKL